MKLFVADYNLIRDSAFTLSSSGESSQKFDFDLDFRVGMSQPSILAFVVSVASGSSAPVLQVSVNGTQRDTALPAGPFVTGLSQVIGGSQLHQGTNNITFAISGGTGSLEVSDVVLHYQRET
ncbi:MAG: hypothetical protein U0822_15145 [Anaerolineae bacterium]